MEFIVNLVIESISRGGYGALFFLMMLESMVAPVPSEAVMPFAGFLVARKQFNMESAIAASTLGSITGSLISYYIGLYGGRAAVVRLGKYLFLQESHLEWTHKFFETYGDPTIFIGRFIPVVRHLISIPAGIGRMNVLKFSFYTILGAAIWNFILTYVGFRLEEKWELIHAYAEYIDFFIIITIVFIILFLFWRHWEKG